MKDRDNFITLNSMKKQNQITLVRLSIESIYMYTISCKGVKYPKTSVITSQPTMIELNNSTNYLKSIRIH